MRLTKKSQVTIPKEIRVALGIGPGSNVAIERAESGDYVLINLDERRKNETPGQQLVRHLRDFGRRMRAEGRTLDLTTDEIMEMTRGPFDDIDPR